MLDTVLLVVGSLSLIVSSILLGVQGPRLDRELERFRRVANEYKRLIDYLQKNQHNFQLWESRGMNLRDTILILDAVNIIAKNQSVHNTIKVREVEMIDTKYLSLTSLSANLGYTDEEIKSWKGLTYDELEKQKDECMSKYEVIVNQTFDSINTIEHHIRTTIKDKARLLYITLFFQIIGLALVLYSKI